MKQQDRSCVLCYSTMAGLPSASYTDSKGTCVQLSCVRVGCHLRPSMIGPSAFPWSPHRHASTALVISNVGSRLQSTVSELRCLSELASRRCSFFTAPRSSHFSAKGLGHLATNYNLAMELGKGSHFLLNLLNASCNGDH